MTAPRPLGDRALDNLSYIRATMERAGSFTAVPGWGSVAVGVTALVATWIATQQRLDAAWLAVWLVEAVVGVAIGGAAMVWKARAANDSLLSGPGRRFGLAFLPPVLVGGLLTIALHQAGLFHAMPGTWLLLYGTACASRCSAPRRCLRRRGGGHGSWPWDSAGCTSCSDGSSHGGTVAKLNAARAPQGAQERPVKATAQARAAELDRLIHERVRLGIVSALAVNDRLSFNELKALLHTTDGNLSVHARKLEDADYVECVKSFAGRVPKTEYRITAQGRRALERYLDHMEALIRATRAR